MKTKFATLSQNDFQLLVSQAENFFPEECCGLLLGQFVDDRYDITKIIVMQNASDTPTTGFEFHPREQLNAYRKAESEGYEVLGHYHSHPNGRRGPSPTDLNIARARLDNGLWLILAVESARFVDASLWQLQGDPGEFVRLNFSISKIDKT